MKTTYFLIFLHNQNTQFEQFFQYVKVDIKVLLTVVLMFLFKPLATETGGSPLDSRHVSVVFIYLLNFCREWHLCKFLILGDLSPHLFALIFLCPTSEKMRVGPSPLSCIKVGFFKTLFFEKQLKKVAQKLFICLCLHIDRHFLGNLVLHFLGKNLNKFGKLYIFPYVYFMLKDHRKPHVGSRYKGDLIRLFSVIH